MSQLTSCGHEKSLFVSYLANNAIVALDVFLLTSDPHHSMPLDVTSRDSKATHFSASTTRLLMHLFSTHPSLFLYTLYCWSGVTLHLLSSPLVFPSLLLPSTIIHHHQQSIPLPSLSPSPYSFFAVPPLLMTRSCRALVHHPGRIHLPHRVALESLFRRAPSRPHPTGRVQHR